MKLFKLNIGLGKRIYIAMVAIILISSLVIGIFTIFFFKNQNEQYHLNRLERKEKRIAKGIEYFLGKNSISENLDEVPKSFYEKIEELSDVNNISINIYNGKGEILFAFSVDDTIVSNINPVIIDELNTSDYDVLIKELSQEHLATYSFIKNNTGKKIGILNIPYHDFTKQSIEFYSFFTTLIEVYLFLLIGASILAYFLSKNITRSLKTIGDNMKNVTIDKKNEKIEWKNKDEIGQLVLQYNNMIDQLENSAELLAQSERESAWREMAKQVAHEIKNPLTPMKLSVQFLEHSLKPDSDDFNEKMKKFSEKMIAQIDALTNIANEFSNFAKMPSTNLESVDIIKLISLAQETFQNEIKIAFNYDYYQEVLINGDKEQLLRVFNNLLKNAVQAIPKETVGVVIINITEEEDIITIEIKDNGQGIPPEQYDKIFVPNFTTKNSGSGLGLAMCKNIIKHHQGIMWFESKMGIGTSFFVSLPKKNTSLSS